MTILLQVSKFIPQSVDNYANNSLWFLGCPQGYVIGVDDMCDMFIILKTKTQKNPPFDTFFLPFELPKFAYICVRTLFSIKPLNWHLQR